jgi:hypothetical protein
LRDSGAEDTFKVPTPDPIMVPLVADKLPVDGPGAEERRIWIMTLAG